MNVQTILVDEIRSSESEATVVATLYEFAHPEWVSVHHERGQAAVGPLALVGGHLPPEEHLLPSIKTQYFGARRLPTERGRTSAISYEETWTTPENCIYTLVLPESCIANRVAVDREGRGWAPELRLAVTPDRRIFYYVVLAGEPSVIHVRARIERSPSAHMKVIDAAEVVPATREFDHLLRNMPGFMRSSDFWFRLVDLGGKLLGGR